MESLAALGLAANIAQFLELGAKIFKDVREITDAGSTISAGHLSTLAADLNHLGARLKDQHTSTALSSGSEEQALCDLASKCSEAAAELTDILESIVRDNPKRAKWKSTLAAFRTVWHQDRINMLAERLAEYRSQLTLRLLMVLNKQQAEGLQAMRDDIVEVVSVNIQDLVAKVGRQKDEMVQRDKAEAIAVDEPIAAVFKTRSGNSTAVGRSTALSSANSHLPRTSITYTHVSRTEGPNATDTAGFRTAKGVYDYEQIIIDALHFRGIAERQSRIDPAYATTFDWMWDGSSHPAFKDVRWDPLGSWLRDRSPAKGNCYWVSGKAGSGKSSLFNYAQRDPLLARHLETWAGSAQLVVSSFYFWYAGTDLQKSHVGLLRALLFGVLTKRPELAAVLFPHICRVIISGDAVDLSVEQSLGELKAAFAKLVQSVPDDLRICFVIDGIDE
ncbi:hypothetical protein GE09DRAFT_455775 [Coniochaeta sp. 2T2.1]|nr:hypothetical protein GE09DRAFT_455775 [Coniochaeta sp. 2T2.1]